MRSAPAAVLNLLLIGLCLATPHAPAQSAPLLPYQDEHLSVERRVDDLVSRMTLEEKVSQTINTAPAIPRLGVPAYDWWNEGLHGVARSGYATMFPQAIGMAATWDADLLGEVGTTISTEARAKYQEAVRHDVHSIYYGLTIWSPNINIFRDPRWGRGQETYGEDPYLTSRLGVRFVQGLQGTDERFFRVIATPKHFAVHSGPESDRHRFNVQPSPHDLWDTYLPAFRAAVVEGRADSIMCAYNAIDGSPACASKELLGAILREKWGFGGFVTSDCGAIDDFFQKNAHRTSPDKESAAAAGIQAGTDTNCGNTYLALTAAVRKGLVEESALDRSLRRLFSARFRLGMFDAPDRNPYSAIPFTEVGSPAHHALALRTARESMVLLKNARNTLPLDSAKLRTLAVIGPNAAALPALEGNYNAVPRNPVLPLDALKAEFPRTRIVYAQGAPYADGVAVPVPRTLLRVAPGSTTEGLQAEYFAGETFEGSPVASRVDRQIDFDWNSASPMPGVPAEAFSVRWSGTLAVPEPGSYDFAMRLAHCYPCGDHERFAVYVDGKLVTEYSSPAGAMFRGSLPPRFRVTVADTRPHPIRIEYRHAARLFGAGIAFEWVPKPGLLETQAVVAAREADAVIAFVGLSPELEGEEMPLQIEGFSGGDRTDIQLPQAQQHLLEAVAATGKPLIVVLMNGSALAVNWAQEHAAAILEAWYPGEAGGQAIAETLSGKNNPGGRLPVTFYRSVDQLPEFSDYSMANRTYRYFKGDPLFGFGFGLSYTAFQYSGLRLSASQVRAGEPLTLEAEVSNTGRRAGDEVAQLYLLPPRTDVSPQRALVGFQRVHLAPGERRHVIFHLTPRDLSEVDAEGVRAMSAGRYTLALGGAQPTASTAQAAFTIEGRRELER